MKTNLSFTNRCLYQIVLMLLCLFLVASPQGVLALQSPKPLVAIHVSELTQALETAPALSPTPTGAAYSGFQWFYTSWHYFVAYESLKESLRADGTPFVEISDSDIASGALLNIDGSPRYPILISLASEAIADNEIAPLRNFVSAGGFLFAGSSAFSRYPGGAFRTNFALAVEMGLNMAHASLDEFNSWNWYVNRHFTKTMDHRLTSHIPAGTLDWNGPLAAGEIPFGISPEHIIHSTHSAWQTVASDATVIATGDAGPLLTVKKYGLGQIIYHGSIQPLLGHGVIDPSTYSYLIFRKAIDWAFESFRLPLATVSPWRYPYDAALVIRHDFECSIDLIKSIELSALFEASRGAVGDYYFCSGVLQSYSGIDKASIITGLRAAVSNSGATIGSHNGGLKNPGNSLLRLTDTDYWHWGPDEALNLVPPGYASGAAYASASVLASFQDIEGWLTGLDNGRAGCGVRGTCPRIWVAPYFNSTREASYTLLAQAGSATIGEQKVGPFPHATLSYTVPGKRFSHVSLPASDWFVGTTIPHALDMGHTVDSMKAAVDFYYTIGGLINLYGHAPANNQGLEQEYVTYSMTKPGIWPTNSVGIHDWWMARNPVSVLPNFTTSGSASTLTAEVSGATDADTSIEIAFPKILDEPVGSSTVLINGQLASPADFRTTTNGIKVRVGSNASLVTVQYSQQSSTVLFSDDFTRPVGSSNPLSPWVTPLGSWSVASGVLRGSSIQQYAYAYVPTTSLWTDYTVKGRIQITAGAFGGGLGGRLNPTTGAHYGAWVYPAGSLGGSNVLKLWKFRGWTDIGTGVPMQQVSLPAVGTGWHALQINFTGNHILVYYDGTLMIDVTDNNYDSRAAYLNGGICAGWYSLAAAYTITVDDISVVATAALMSPVPVSTSLSPTTVLAGGAAFTLTVTGSGFVSGSTVLWNGTSRTTTYISPTQLTAAVPAVDIATAGTASITVVTPAPGGGTASALTFTIDTTPTPATLFSDDFTRPVNALNPLSPWVASMGTWSVAGGVMQGSGNPMQYSYTHIPGTSQWNDYTVQGRIQIPAGTFGGGLGGRLDTATGAHYGAWVYPAGSPGGSNVLKLWKFRGWTDIGTGVPMQQVSLPAVGTGWHTLQLNFTGNRIIVSYDGNPVIDVTDASFDSRVPYTSGGISADWWIWSSASAITIDDVTVVVQ